MEITDRNEKREREDLIWRVAVTAVLTGLCALAILTAGCSQGATNITGPSSSTTSTRLTIDSATDSDAALVKQYNYGLSTTRWDKSVITVYDTSTTVFQEDLNDWNNYLNGARLILVDASPADIEVTGKDGGCSGMAFISDWKGVITKVTITITKPYPLCGTREKAKHEIGHAIGFGINNNIKHTSNGGVMDSSAPSLIITDTVARTIRKLYSLPPATQIT